MTAITLPDYVKANEGLRLKLYEDTRGVPTIGWGRNLRNDGISQAEAQLLFDNDLANATRAAVAAYGVSGWTVLDSARRLVLVDMAFELGQAGLSEFVNMLAAIRARDWQGAHDQLLASAYAQQVPNRATANANILLTGDLPDAPALAPGPVLST